MLYKAVSREEMEKLPKNKMYQRQRHVPYMDIDIEDIQIERWSVKVRHGDQQGWVFLLLDVGVHQLLIYFSSLLSSLRM